MSILPASLTKSVFAAIAAIALAGCGGSEVDADGPVEGLVEMSKGSADAAHTLIEYASTTCGACGSYHATMSETIDQLVDEGKLRFVFRDFPRDSVDSAAFVLARCGGADSYFDILDDIYEHQQGLLAAARNGQVRGVLETIGERHGVDAAKYKACLEDESLLAQLEASVKQGRADGVSGTPTLFFDGLETTSARTPESLIEMVDPAAAVN